MHQQRLARADRRDGVNPDPSNLLLAATAMLGYLVLCALTWRRTRARRRGTSRLTAAGTGASTRLLVVHASQTGTAEGLAEQTAAALQTAGVEVLLRPLAQLDMATLQTSDQALFIVSTYGEGDPPDGAAHFVANVMRDPALNLASLRYGLLSLGDRTYRNFCGFGRDFDAWLQQHGASALFSRIDVDSYDSSALQAWRHQLGHIAATTDEVQWHDLPYQQWVLRARHHLNPGSQGAPVFQLELVRDGDATRGWEAGDLLQIQVPGDPDRPRDYSIASVAAEGAVHLLVRLQIREDGSKGGGSGWLTSELAVGALLRGRLRTHSTFRMGANAGRDLILIGNGTGLAGLRAHLKQRELERAEGTTARRHWLIYGERQAASDALLGVELAQWRESALLTRLDLVYSRDGGVHRYVQDSLREQGDQLREWIDAGAAIYVCGSLEGMAEAVDSVLRAHLGEETLARLQQEGRYRRDVY
jgi:sulfite reductase (NADPH) flavoprotein alpha-component